MQSIKVLLGVRQVLSLRMRGFLDKHARILDVYFNTYNANSDLFLCTKLQIKFAHTSGVQQVPDRTTSLLITIICHGCCVDCHYRSC